MKACIQRAYEVRQQCNPDIGGPEATPYEIVQRAETVSLPDANRHKQHVSGNVMSLKAELESLESQIYGARTKWMERNAPRPAPVVPLGPPLAEVPHQPAPLFEGALLANGQPREQIQQIDPPLVADDGPRGANSARGGEIDADGKAEEHYEDDAEGVQGEDGRVEEHPQEDDSDA